MVALPKIGRAGGVRRLLVFLAGMTVTGFCAAEGAAPFPAAVEQAAQANITRQSIEAPIRFLGSDALEGRGPGSRGDQLARLYLSTELSEGLGLRLRWTQRSMATAGGVRFRTQGAVPQDLELSR